jgi:hypothetical protein
VDPCDRAARDRTPEERERLAKEWLLRMIESTPLVQVGDLPVDKIATEVRR